MAALSVKKNLSSIEKINISKMMDIGKKLKAIKPSLISQKSRDKKKEKYQYELRAKNNPHKINMCVLVFIYIYMAIDHLQQK